MMFFIAIWRELIHPTAICGVFILWCAHVNKALIENRSGIATKQLDFSCMIGTIAMRNNHRYIIGYKAHPYSNCHISLPFSLARTYSFDVL